MTAVVRNIVESPEPSVAPASGGAPTPGASAGPGETAPAEHALGVQVDSTSVWAGGHSPVILQVTAPDAALDAPPVFAACRRSRTIPSSHS